MRSRIGLLVVAAVVLLVIAAGVWWVLQREQGSRPSPPPPEQRSELRARDVAFTCEGLPLQLESVTVEPSPMVNTWYFELHCNSDEPCVGTADVVVRYRTGIQRAEMQFQWWLAIQAGQTVRLGRQQRDETQIMAVDEVEVRAAPGATNPMAGA